MSSSFPSQQPSSALHRSNDHVVSFSFNSFIVLASFWCRKCRLSRYRRVVRRLGRTAVDQGLPYHEPMTWLRLSDSQDRGSCCAFCRVGQGHRKLIVQLDMLVVFSMETVSPRLRSLRVTLNQQSSLMCRVDISQPRSDLACKRHPIVCCLTSFLGRVVLRPSIIVCLQSLRSGSFRCSQWRWPGSVMTRLLVRLDEGFPSSTASVLPVLPVLQLCADNSSARC